MESSRILVAPGLRTAASPGWRARFETAAGIVRRSPRLWLYGAIGFSLRGGALLLVVPITVVPTQVEARGLLGSNLGSMGFTEGFWGLVAVAALVSTAAAIGIAALLARLELAGFERVSGALGGGGGRAPRAARRHTVPWLFAVQVLSMAAIAVCAVPLATAVGAAAYDEIVRPSSTVSIYARVLAGVGPQLYLFVLAVLVIEMLSALTTREILARAARDGSASVSSGRWLLAALRATGGRLLHVPARTLSIVLMGWAVTAAAVGAALWGIGIAWQPVRAVFLTSLPVADMSDDVAMLTVAVGFGAAFVLAMLVTGFASALRGAIWSVDRLS